MQLDILENGQKTGTLTIKDAGLYLQFTARCPLCGSGVKRLRLCGKGSEYVLGIPVPDNGTLLLTKSVSKSEYTRRFPNAAEFCVLEPVDPPAGDDLEGWTPCEDPASFFRDRELAAACPSRNICTKTRGDTVFLAFPLVPGQPFPLLPIFRFGHTEIINGKEFVVFSLKNGEPT